jgi:4-hydroxy-tetrahydrodipicolinate reductase
MIRVAVVGASGRMGLCLIKAVELAEKTTLSAAISRAGSVSVGTDAGELAGIGTLDTNINDDLAGVLDQFDVLMLFALLLNALGFQSAHDTLNRPLHHRVRA